MDSEPGASIAETWGQALGDERDRGRGRHAHLPEVSRGSGDFWKPLLCDFQEVPSVRHLVCAWKAHWVRVQSGKHVRAWAPGGRAGCPGPEGDSLRHRVETWLFGLGESQGRAWGWWASLMLRAEGEVTRAGGSSRERDFGQRWEKLSHNLMSLNGWMAARGDSKPSISRAIQAEPASLAPVSIGIPLPPLWAV